MATDRTIDRWWIAFVVALVPVGIGLLFARVVPFYLGAVGLVYVAYRQVGVVPDATMKIDRTVSDREPRPGEPIEVTVTIDNQGGPVFDLRFVDGVPPALEVIDGSPRKATALRSGEQVSISYSIRAEPGQHGFEPATVITRDPSGSVEREQTIAHETVITCLPPLSAIPLRSQTTQYTGDIRTKRGGSGLEFHSTRRYRPGDPLARIDWNRLASSGEMTTIDFHEERAASVVIVIDARPAAYWASDPESRHVVEAMVRAAGQVFTTLLAGGDRVGIAGLGPEPCWLAPSAEAEHRYRARKLLATHDAFQYIPHDNPPPELAIDPEHSPVDVDDLLAKVSGDTQVILFSPLLDDGIAEAALTIESSGHSLSTISPNVTSNGSMGRRLATLQRRNRLHSLREAGVMVVDWDPQKPLETATTRAIHRK